MILITRTYDQTRQRGRVCLRVCVFIKLHIMNHLIRPCRPSYYRSLALFIPSNKRGRQSGTWSARHENVRAIQTSTKLQREHKNKNKHNAKRKTTEERKTKKEIPERLHIQIGCRDAQRTYNVEWMHVAHTRTRATQKGAAKKVHSWRGFDTSPGFGCPPTLIATTSYSHQESCHLPQHRTLKGFRLPYCRSHRRFGNPWFGPIDAALKRLKLPTVSLDATLTLSVFPPSLFLCRVFKVFSPSISHLPINLQPP